MNFPVTLMGRRYSFFISRSTLSIALATWYNICTLSGGVMVSLMEHFLCVQVVQAINYIFKSLGIKAVPYISQVSYNRK
jgi:hypothetical protein